MIWRSGQMSLFLFLLAKASWAYLPTALFVALKSLSPFRNAQYDYVFPLKPAPFCKLFARLGSTSKSITSLLFSSYLTLVLSSPLCLFICFSFYLNLSGISGRNCFLSLPILSDNNGSVDICLSRGMTRLMSWPDGKRYSCPLQSLVISLL